MHPNFPSSSLLMICSLLLLLSHQFRCSVCLDDHHYSSCSSLFECGPVLGKIGFPFWGGNRPDYCGHPSFQLVCEDGKYAFIKIEGQKYEVIHINNVTGVLTIVNLNLSIEDHPMPCPQNISMNSTLFDYTDNVGRVNFTLGYNCRSVGSDPESNDFTCKLGGGDHQAYLSTDSSDAESSCQNRIVIDEYPVLKPELERLLNGSTPDVVGLLKAGFEVKWKADQARCQKCIRSGGKCGFNGMTNQSCCYCRDKPYPYKCSMSPGTSKKIILAVLGAGVGIVLAIILIIFKIKILKHRLISIWRKGSNADQNIEEFLKNYGSQAPKRYSYSDVKKMTDSFRDKLGQGGYGSVFKGKLADGNLVAVKVLNTSKGNNGEEFINEVASISRTSHVNIVSLLGFCFEGGKKALIYEFMSHGSLENYLCSTDHQYPLTANKHLGWEKLYDIAVGIARGLEYLHSGCRTRIVHFDVKPHNILLNQDFSPKISDFGLAKLSPQNESILSMSVARGTIGYVAPEVFSRNFGRVSHKSDVYSYGMMLLEMVGGRWNVNSRVDGTSDTYFPHWIYKNLEQQDGLGLEGSQNKEEDEVTRKMILVGLWCIQTDPSQRPGMSKVIEMLEGRLEALQVPPKPYLFSPPRLSIDSSSFNSTPS